MSDSDSDSDFDSELEYKFITKKQFQEIMKFIKTDIGREIKLAKISQRLDNNDSELRKKIKEQLPETSEEIKDILSEYLEIKGAGNMMLLLSLMAYTEFGGLMLEQARNREDLCVYYKDEEFFNIELDTYLAENRFKECLLFIKTSGEHYEKMSKNFDLYNILYNGLKHQYYPKCNIKVCMLENEKTKYGFYCNESGEIIFCIEKFYNELMSFFEEMEQKWNEE